MFDAKNFIKQLIGYFPSQIVPALSNLGIILLLTRFMDVEDYGLYSLLITSANLCVTIFTQWMMQSILFYRPKSKKNGENEKFDNLIEKTYILLTFLFMSVVIFFVIVSFFINISLSLVLPFIMIILFNSIFVINQTILQSDMKINRYSFQISVSTILKLILIAVITIYYKASLPFLLWAIALSYFIFVIPKFIEITKKKTHQQRLNKTEYKDFIIEMLQYGFPMLGWFLATSLISITDRYVLAIFNSTYEVGLYSANVAVVSSALGLVFAPFTKAIHPIIMNAANESKDLIGSLISKFSLFFIILGIPIIVIITLLRNEISSLLLGEAYIEGSIIIPYTICGLFLWNLAMVGHKGFEVSKNTKIMFKYVIIACLINVILNFALIPFLGILGAGIASLIAYGSYPILIKVNSRKSIYWSLAWKKIFVFIILGIIAYFIGKILMENLSNNILLLYILVISIPVLLLYFGLIYVINNILNIKIMK